MLMGTVLVVRLRVFIKWEKSLLVVINLEIIRIAIISGLWALGASLRVRIVVILTFFVGEALILLRALYGALRSVGAANGVLIWA